MTVINKTFFEHTIRLFWILSGVLTFLIGTYLILLVMTVSEVVGREKAETRLSELYSKVGELESLYLSKKNTVTLGKAEVLGFRETAKIDFIKRKPLSNLLTLNGE